MSDHTPVFNDIQQVAAAVRPLAAGISASSDKWADNVCHQGPAYNPTHPAPAPTNGQ